jgi:phage portal protein BeeE
MPWPWTKKSDEQPGPSLPSVQPLSPSMIYDTFESFSDMARVLAATQAADQKNFDWNHYQAMQGGFQSMFAGEFNLVPTMRILKGMLIQEPWINACVNAISRQFLASKFLILEGQSKDGQQKKIAKHPMLAFLRNAGKDVESSAYFTANCMTDMVLTGNAYWYQSQDLKDKRRIPAERIEPVVENNRIKHYRLLDKDPLGINGPNQIIFQPEEITHIKMPNPFSPHIGLSMIIATVLPVLIDKYGREYVVGFFLRGGQTSSIIETDTSNIEQLLRFARTLMQAFGGRKNMHTDKVLPKGAKWVGQGSSFGEIRLVEMLKDNVGHFRAATGCTNTVLGIVDNVNRATAQAEMELFWKLTILPLQKLFCAGIQASSTWTRLGLDDERHELIFDNSGIEYIDDFDQKLEQDAKLNATWTINERRERLGKEPLDGYDRLEIELRPQPAAPLSFAFPGQQQGVMPTDPNQMDLNQIEASVPDKLGSWKAEEKKIQDPTRSAYSLFAKEFGAWEEIIVDNLLSKSAALAKIHNRSEAFAQSFADKAIEPAMKAYGHQMDSILQGEKAVGGIRTKESQQDRAAKLALLKERAEQVIKQGIFDNGRRSFIGYSSTAMDHIYDFITAEFEQGKSSADVASSVRTKFSEMYGIDEAYPGQAETIVNTEFRSAVSIGIKRFGEDLATVTKKMSKSWVTLEDEFVRDDHQSAEAEGPIEGDSDFVVNATFQSTGLRYPREAGGPAAQIVNCRCALKWDVVEWTD